MGFRTPALTQERNDAIEQRLKVLETKPALDHDRIALAIERLRDPDQLRARLGDALRYSQRVEAEVGNLGIETLLPNANGDYVGRFLTTWSPDELGHAAAQERLLKVLGLPVYEPRPGDHVPTHNRMAGVLGRVSGHVYEMVSMMYHSIGAINERLAMGAYRRMSTIATDLGETELVEVLLNPMRRDEAAHLGYYRTYARQLRPRLRDWQLAVVRATIVHTYAPVGAGGEADKAPFGRALLALENDPEDPGIADAVHEIAAELLSKPGRTLPPFVHRSLMHCVALARAGTAA